MPTSRAKKPVPPGVSQAKTVVPSSSEMLQLILRQHIQKRHPQLGFWTKNEHDQDHRLRQEQLDHVHSDMVQTAEPEQDVEENPTEKQEAAVDAKDEG